MNKKALDTDINISLFSDIGLKIRPVANNGDTYPTAQLQKGLLLISNGQELAEEGVGFGVPIVKMGVRTIFPGMVELDYLRDGLCQQISARFLLNLEERLVSKNRGNINSKKLYWVKNRLADMHRHFPPLRNALTGLSNALRSSFGWQTSFENAGFSFVVKLNYRIDAEVGIISVDVDATGVLVPGVTELVLMNEQGANYFDTYLDSNGNLLKEGKVGNWDEVIAENASFLSSSHHLAFSLQQINGARLYRGRELIAGRLAWSGFGYSVSPVTQRFNYTLVIERPS